jgi:uncharacterized membrane protein required for colicin V production
MEDEMNWLLIVVVAILVGNTLIGMKAGLIKTIFSLCSMVVAVVLTIWISPHVNDFMKGNDKIYDAISSKVEKILPLAEKEAGSSEEVSIIEGLMLPQSIKDALIENNNAKVYKAMAIDSFEEYVSGYITGVIINAMAFAITFLVIIILLWIICLSLDIISKLPLLNEVNKTGGLIAGLFHGLVVVWLFFILITVFGSTEYGQKALEMIGDNSLLSLIYNNNFILKFIMNATKIVF